MMSIAIYTLGCKANQYDSAAMAARLAEAGHEIVAYGQEADAVVINTCTVTGESDRKGRQMIRRARQQNPSALLCVCGCMAQREAESLLRMGADLVLGTVERMDIVLWLHRAMEQRGISGVRPFERAEVYEDAGGALMEHARAFVKIQDGCDRRCAYCAIPLARGPVRSRRLDSIRQEMQAVADSGRHEAVLTGIRLTAYGQGMELTLADAVEAAAATDISRIRLGSLDPDGVDEVFLSRAAATGKLCPHFHLSLQSGSDEVLRRMRRPYDTAVFAKTVKLIEKYFPEAALTTDVMVGFPGENDAAFEQTCLFVRRMGFSRLHVFPYSRRKDTPAAQMPEQCSAQVKRQRVAALMAIGTELEGDFYRSLEGKTRTVIWEQRNRDGLWEGHGEDYSLLRMTGETEGPIQSVRVTEGKGDHALTERS